MKNLSTLLQKVTVLVYDPDPPIAGIVRQVLNRLGFGRIYIAFSAEEALGVFSESHIDLIITDNDGKPVRDGLSFISYIRTSPDSTNQTVPIIMLSGRTAEEEVIRARDEGITEFAAKPFTAKSLTDRIIGVIENPRSFIITKRYVGPDRRRKDVPPPMGMRRKVDGEEDGFNYIQATQQNTPYPEDGKGTDAGRKKLFSKLWK